MADDQRENEIDFAMFLMYRLSEAWGIPVASVYRKLEGCGALSNYIFPFYDVLHTQGSEYLVEDLTEYVRRRGGDV